ncbi:MAG: 30S ribosomal protein S6 [Bdellovibrionales bacterium GWB1_55_8]|nr:MAG: 30S ribosomal protein S6 [Bdellovibrionales bacterium GWB1_55_8]
MANTASADIRAGYETTMITRSELSDDALKALQEKLAGVVTEFGGEIVLTEDWGRRKLAYPIQKESRGHYNYFVYSGKGEIVHEIERHLRLHEHVLRFLTVNLEKEFNAENFRKQRAEVHAAAKRREEEREARREERDSRRSYHDRGESSGDIQGVEISEE